MQKMFLFGVGLEMVCPEGTFACWAYLLQGSWSKEMKQYVPNSQPLNYIAFDVL